MRVVVDMALGDHDPDLKDQICDRIHSQAPHWGPLGTTTTLVDHWFMSEASLPQIKTAFVSLTDMFGGIVRHQGQCHQLQVARSQRVFLRFAPFFFSHVVSYRVQARWLLGKSTTNPPLTL